MTHPRSSVHARLLAVSLVTCLLVTSLAGPVEALPTPPLRIVSIVPCRIVDTRSADMPAGYGVPNLTSGEARPFILAGQSHCHIPENARGAVLNVTAVATAGNGNLRLYPTGAPTPTASNVNFRTGTNTANAAIIALGDDGGLNVLASFAAAGVVLDITGYLTDEAGPDALVFQGTWDPDSSYARNDLVHFNGSTYISLASENQGHSPDGGAPNWSLLAAGGQRGETGPQGAQGAQGAQGLQGEQGLPGLTWHQEWLASTAYQERDAVAYQGSSYVSLSNNTGVVPGTNAETWQVLSQAGAPGAQGPVGPKGDAGAEGAQGAQGAKGDTGPQGPQGTTGPKGDTGLQGPAGLKGDTGATGPQGATGLKGDTGLQGPQGTQGAKGDTGPQGPQGPQGTTGPKGDTGLQGPAGLKGDTGATGPQGPAGPTGPQGLQGLQGLQGPSGPAGTSLWNDTVVNGRSTVVTNADVISGTTHIQGGLRVDGGISYPGDQFCRDGGILTWGPNGLGCSGHFREDGRDVGQSHGTFLIEGILPEIRFADTDPFYEWLISAGGTGFDIREGPHGYQASRFKIAPGGRVGIGTADPQNALHIHSWNGGILFTDENDRGHSWLLAGNNQFGNFSIIHDNDYAFLLDNARNTFLYGNLTINGTGFSGGGWQQTSDARLKNHVVTLEGALDRVLRLRGVEFEWTRDTERSARLPAGPQIGLIAQEVEAVVPEVVATDGEGYKSVAYSNLTGLLVEAIKEQQGTIERQAGELAEQRKETAALAARLARLEKALAHAARD